MIERTYAPRLRLCFIPEEGMHFCGTFDNEAGARRMADAHGLVVKPFGVDLKTAPPLVWEKVEGWSTWQASDQ